MPEHAGLVACTNYAAFPDASRILFFARCRATLLQPLHPSVPRDATSDQPAEVVTHENRTRTSSEKENKASVFVARDAEGLEQVDGVTRAAATVAAMVADVVEPLSKACPERFFSGNAAELAVDNGFVSAVPEEKGSPPGVESPADAGAVDATGAAMATAGAVEPPNTSEPSSSNSATFAGAVTICEEGSAAVGAVVEELGRHVPWTPMLSYTCPFVFIWCVRCWTSRVHKEEKHEQQDKTL